MTEGATTQYPRYVIDSQNKRFSGGGVSSSIDLALELVSTIKNKNSAEMAELMIQYSPDPPVRTGDPSTADEKMVNTARKLQQESFIGPIARATDKVLGQCNDS